MQWRVWMMFTGFQGCVGVQVWFNICDESIFRSGLNITRPAACQPVQNTISRNPSYLALWSKRIHLFSLAEAASIGVERSRVSFLHFDLISVNTMSSNGHRVCMRQGDGNRTSTLCLSQSWRALHQHVLRPRLKEVSDTWQIGGLCLAEKTHLSRLTINLGVNQILETV